MARRRRSEKGPKPTWPLLLGRDGDICYLCGEPIDLKAPPGSPRGPSVDHVTPRSLGGSDTMTNCRITHGACNWAKGDSMPPPPILAAHFISLGWSPITPAGLLHPTLCHSLGIDPASLPSYFRA